MAVLLQYGGEEVDEIAMENRVNMLIETFGTDGACKTIEDACGLPSGAVMGLLVN